MKSIWQFITKHGRHLILIPAAALPGCLVFFTLASFALDGAQRLGMIGPQTAGRILPAVWLCRDLAFAALLLVVAVSALLVVFSLMVMQISEYLRDYDKGGE